VFNPFALASLNGFISQQSLLAWSRYGYTWAYGRSCAF